MSTYELYLEIKGLPKTINEIGRSHWSVKARETKKWKHQVYYLALSKKPTTPLKKAKIHYERHSSSPPDLDNIISGFKSCQDGLTMAGIIIDDSMKVIETTYTWVKSKPKQGKITIRVTSCE